MLQDKIPHTIDLTHPGYLQTLVESRRIFSLNHCELNIFESYEKAFEVPLTFSDLVITSMIRGKKVMHLFDDAPFDYLPGETVIVPGNATMRIDFPEAEMDNPTQCIALAVSPFHLQQTIDYLNEHYPLPDEQTAWDIQFSKYHFENDTEITGLINKMMRLCMSADKAKDIYADLSMKELLIRLVQSQNLHQTENKRNNGTRLGAVLQYIHRHLHEKLSVEALSRKACLNRSQFFRLFKDQFGLTPVEYINRERLRLAKKMILQSQETISSISYQCGFSDINYFSRLFKRSEGVSPTEYALLQGKS